MPAVVTGDWLKSHRQELDRGEATWLANLARFDVEGGWALDGQLSCAEWLVEHLHMARSTAFEKLQVARTLRTRPLVAEAFESGRISYSAARALCRMHDPDPAVDRALLEVAEHQSIRDLERLVRTYHAYQDQDRAPDGSAPGPGIRVHRWAEGYLRLQVVLPDLEAQEVLGVLRLFTARAKKAARESAGVDVAPGSALPAASDGRPALVEGTTTGSAITVATEEVDQPDMVDDAGRCEPEVDPEPDTAPWAAALVDISRAAVAFAGPPATTADRYLVHLLIDEQGEATLADGGHVPAPVAAGVLCDASFVVHCQRDGAPLRLGRRTRHWSTAQRRAALVRDGGHCRFPGCTRRNTDLHHHDPWEAGGPTDIENGVTLCRHHHTLIHKEGFRARGEPNGLLTFSRPDETPIGTSAPTVRRLPAAPRSR